MSQQLLFMGYRILHKVVPSFILLFFLLVSAAAYAEEQASFERSLTKGILALDRQEYGKAVEYFTAAVKAKPDDPSANLYLGIALNNSGNEREGEKFLKKALKLDPLSPQTNLELGILYYKKGLHAEARDFFETAKSNDTGTDIADLADEYIEDIDQEGMKVKDWALNFTAGGQYDSNVILDSGAGPLPEGISRKSDWRAILFVEGKFTPRLTDQITLGPTYSFYQSLQAELTDFNVQQHLPGVLFDIALGKNVLLKTSYFYEYTKVGNEEYISAHSISPVVSISEGRGFFTVLRYQYQKKDFKDSDMFPNNSERDGFNNLGGISQYVPLSRMCLMGLHYAYDYDSAAEKYWSYSGNAGHVDLRFNLGKSWNLDLYGQYYQKDYKAEYPGTSTKRTDKMATFYANLTKTFASRFDITAGWMYVNNNSNIDVFEYDRNIATLTLRVSL
jgi:tetratricopeptide (TPR) repeat protein